MRFAEHMLYHSHTDEMHSGALRSHLLFLQEPQGNLACPALLEVQFFPVVLVLPRFLFSLDDPGKCVNIYSVCDVWMANW